MPTFPYLIEHGFVCGSLNDHSLTVRKHQVWCETKQNQKEKTPLPSIWKEKLSEKGKQTAGMTATSNTME